MIPEVCDQIVLIKDDYYSECKKGQTGTVENVSIWYWRADIRFSDGGKNVHFDNIELTETHRLIDRTTLKQPTAPQGARIKHEKEVNTGRGNRGARRSAQAR